MLTISRSSQYAIQALVYIELQEIGANIPINDLSSNIGISGAYLVKIMQKLCRHGLIRSRQGRHGGFRLLVKAEEINLMSVLTIIEGERFHRECLLGLRQCGDETACPLHAKWKPIKCRIIEQLESQNIATLAQAVLQGEDAGLWIFAPERRPPTWQAESPAIQP